MKAKNATLYSTVVLFAGLAAAPASHGIGLGELQRPAGIIQQRMEDRTDRLIERAAERRTQQAIPEPPVELPVQMPGLPPGLLAELPDRVAVLTKNGSQAFVDVRVEDGWRAVEKQWLVALDSSEVSLFEQPGIQIIDQMPLPELDLNVVRFRVAEELDSRTAISRLLPASVVERLDRNHIYSHQGDPRNAMDNGSGASRSADAVNTPLSSSCAKPMIIGMVDTAIQSDHPSFSNANIMQKRFLEDVDEPVDHGTAVASVLVGHLPGQSAARLPQATLFNASVFFSRQQLASGATLMHMVEGLNWLVAQDVSVINISMAGPDNRLLAVVTQRIFESGIPLVAAVGNQGPAAPPLYPAAYPHVLGITAVDQAGQVYRWANQGAQVAFAAYGVDVLLAGNGGRFNNQRGTSMASPVVAARLACAIATASAPFPDLLERLTRQAIDLGEPGRDPVFGYGLLGSN